VLRTFGNDNGLDDGGNVVETTDYGRALKKSYYPDDPNTVNPTSSISVMAGERGFFAPHMSFNAAITFDSGSLNASIDHLTLDIPLIQDDKMVQSIDPSASTMKFNMFLGVYEDNFPIKKIRLEDVNGDPIELDASDATAVQGDSEKTNTIRMVIITFGQILIKHTLLY
jgi:hypothetical protein